MALDIRASERLKARKTQGKCMASRCSNKICGVTTGASRSAPIGGLTNLLAVRSVVLAMTSDFQHRRGAPRFVGHLRTIDLADHAENCYLK